MTWEWHGMERIIQVSVQRTASVENETLLYTCNYFKLAIQVMYINGSEYLPIVLILTHKIQLLTTFRSLGFTGHFCDYNRHFA